MNTFLLILILFTSLFLGLNIIKNTKDKLTKYLYGLLFSIHFCTTLSYNNISSLVKKDSHSFFDRALNSESWTQHLRPGSDFISFLLYPFVKLGVEYFIISQIFALIGLVGLVKIFSFFFPLNTFLKKTAIIFMLFPSIHFWTSGITKEALVIFFMALILEEIFKNRTTSIKIIIALIMILFIRPYLFILLLISLCAKFLFFEKNSITKRLVSITTFLILSLISIPFLKVFFKIETYRFSEIQNLFIKIDLYSKTVGNTSISLESTNYFERLIIVLFRPFFFDSSNHYQYIISIENAIFLAFCVVATYLATKTKIIINSVICYLILSSLLVIFLLSTYMYNLGLASRMRVMFLPFLVLGVVLIFNSNKTLINEKEVN